MGETEETVENLAEVRDWAEIISEIQTGRKPDGKKWTYEAISHETGMAISSICRLVKRDMPEPKHSEGQILLRIHAEVINARQTT